MVINKKRGQMDIHQQTLNMIQSLFQLHPIRLGVGFMLIFILYPIYTYLVGRRHTKEKTIKFLKHWDMKTLDDIHDANDRLIYTYKEKQYNPDHDYSYQISNGKSTITNLEVRRDTIENLISSMKGMR